MGPTWVAVTRHKLRGVKIRYNISVLFILFTEVRTMGSLIIIKVCIRNISIHNYITNVFFIQWKVRVAVVRYNFHRVKDVM